MGIIPPPIYDGSEESKRQFEKWLLREARIGTFRMYCIVSGVIVMTSLLILMLLREMLGY